jgi:hypothetical protein
MAESATVAADAMRPSLVIRTGVACAARSAGTTLAVRAANFRKRIIV